MVYVNEPIGTEIDLVLDRKDVCRFLGYSADVEPSTRIASLLHDYIVKAQRLVEPSYTYVIRDVGAVEGSRVVVEGPIEFESEAVAGLLRLCQKVAVFLLTIGSRLEERAAWLAEHRVIVQSYVLDGIGSSATERLADFVQGRIEEAMRPLGLCTSRRMSPGYCDWYMSQQQLVFSLLDADSCGVQLTEDYMMIPQKSMSGIIGIGPCGGGVEDYNPCMTCSKRGCPGRR